MDPPQLNNYMDDDKSPDESAQSVHREQIGP